jgi:ABC-type glycerol-3-phosphate transport system substrate-binding protein
MARRRGSTADPVTRRILIRGGGAGAGILLAACGDRATRGESRAPLTGEEEFWGFADPETAEIARRFEQTNPGVKMNFSVPSGLQDKLIVAVAAGWTPSWRAPARARQAHGALVYVSYLVGPSVGTRDLRGRAQS